VSKGKNKGKQIEGKESIYELSDSQAKTVRYQIENEIKKKEPEQITEDEMQPNKCLSCDRFSGCMLLSNSSQVEVCQGPYAETITEV